jgi:SPP1 family predicted phage head-tail adaptor
MGNQPSPVIEAGQLNRRVNIQQQSTSPDSVGQPAQTWTTVYSCWASIDVINAALLYSTETFVSNASSLIGIRYTSSIIFNVGDQIVYIEDITGVVHTYQIKAVINKLQRNRQIVFLCYELNPQE